ncbi:MULTISPECIES: phosphoadenosine phosphosulfate reductase family protein [unclassified Paenibacillus]|uniref:phosphoadenosine phosphosulfate reductase domain-containing protein n=1 Tax=unclassified Paenibacillus TaxID=185978 RepID=UPI00277FA2FF|nr:MULTISPECIES: phosphoadenosine phosphosulfate reductase family protein [unclassified Paenibacillus]MDQ0896350.1 DNA sulfur modification protein DndC [Paenibacillus sp. V4I7]MDQ0914107.1 DNA sulfur modification protein DndC [Paenibacillus sp. V4I5]
MINIFELQEEQNVNANSRSIIDELKVMYMRDSRVWIAPTSHGKDSSMQLDLLWRAILEIPPEARTKPLHVVTSVTGVEIPAFENHVRNYVRKIQQAAREQNLPIYVHLSEPDMDKRFLSQVLGFGNPPPTESSRFRWCSDKTKLDPVTKIVNRIMADRMVLDDYDAIMFLGVRNSESTKRKASIAKHSLDDKFARHSDHPRILVYHPIVDFETDDVWDYLLNRGRLAWGSETSELLALYNASNGGECELTAPTGKQTSSCGGSRFGCYTCCHIGRKDNMLANLYNQGDAKVLPLYKWKVALYDLRNDARFRLPLRKRVHGKLKGEIEYLELDAGTEDSIWRYTPGPISIVGRKMLLQGLLHAELVSGYLEDGFQLLDEDEIDFILECWEKEGFSLKREELKPTPIQVDDLFALKPNGILNDKDSTYRGDYSEIIYDVTPSELAAIQERCNTLFQDKVWVPSADRKRVKELQLKSSINI